MPFVDKKGAMKLLKEIENGKCAGNCRAIWMRNIKYALKTETNPLKLTKTEREKMLKMIEKISGKKSKKKEKSGKKLTLKNIEIENLLHIQLTIIVIKERKVMMV